MGKFVTVGLGVVIAASTWMLSGCSKDGNGGSGSIKERMQESLGSTLAESVPRAMKLETQTASHGLLESSEAFPRNTWVSWGPAYVLNLVPGDGVIRYRLISLPKAWVTALFKGTSTAGIGCADGVREAFINVADYPDIAGCQGDFSPNQVGSDQANAHCAQGWRVCSPAGNPNDAAILSSISYTEATGFGSCFAYNGANDNDGCGPCDGTWENPKIMGGVGSECAYGSYYPDGSSCLQDGRVDLGIPADCRDDATIKGVVCCKQDSTPEPTVCPSELYGFPEFRLLDDCGNVCVEYGQHCQPLDPPDEYSEPCERDGYIWYCLPGGSCDMITPIDFYAMAYAPETYCEYPDPEGPCPAEFPLSCGHVCCTDDSVCENGLCRPNCQGPISIECLISGLFTVCCENGECYENTCYCPEHLSCNEWCCNIYEQHCHLGMCHDRSACSTPKYPTQCMEKCCLEGATCLGDNECSCPPHLPLACGEECCAEGAVCENGRCSGGCPGDHPLECRTDSGNQCCLPGAACLAEGCECPPNLPGSCGENCCVPEALCIEGECQLVKCQDSEYPTPCGQIW